MDVVTWNVNSLKARAGYVARYLDAASPDVLCIQELKLEDHKVPTEIFEERGYHLAIHGQKQWNGVLIASKTPLDEIHMGLPGGDEGQSRLVSARTAGIHFVNLYCPQGQAVDSPKFPYKLGFYRALNAWLRERFVPGDRLCVLGDMNIAPGPGDVWSVDAVAGKPTYHPLEHEAWAELIGFGLEDVVLPYLKEVQFSFYDYRGAAFRFNQGYRIDHILLTAPLCGAVSNGWIDRDFRKKKDDLKASDHAPVGITLDV